MRQLLKYILSLAFVMMTGNTAVAQITKWQSVHVVAKKETLFGIARHYGITMDQLAEANPEIKAKDYKLKKGTTLFIPYPQPSAAVAAATAISQQPVAPTVGSAEDLSTRAVRVGVVLPLNNNGRDGRRMLEYYRGILMACDSLKHKGMNIDVKAWNAPQNADIQQIATLVEATKPDLIIGPFYANQTSALASMSERCGASLLIPFSINAPQLYTNSHIFQVYQTQQEQSETMITLFMKQFGNGFHPVVIDCGDTTSTKGVFTTGLRRELEVRHIDYSLTSLTTATANFVKAFSTTQPNVVVLNSASQQSLNSAFGKLSAVQLMVPEAKISTFGYTEWIIFTNSMIENYYKFEVSIPSPFYTNLASPATKRLVQKYRWNFHQEMMASYPRFALTGFDHAFFFLKGLKQYGRAFDGAYGKLDIMPVQTPLRFERIGAGGYQNRVMQLIRYKANHQVEWTF